MGIRSQNNSLAAYLDVFSRSGTDAAGAGSGGGSSSGITATGGVISDYTSGSDVYRAHIFTTSGDLDVTALGDFGDSVEYIIVGGGGGGGFDRGGGGGAGAFYPASLTASIQPYPVVIGAGGGGAGSAIRGHNGGDTTFGSITVKGGGGGGSNGTNQRHGGNSPDPFGGSGGGGSQGVTSPYAGGSGAGGDAPGFSGGPDDGSGGGSGNAGGSGPSGDGTNGVASTGSGGGGGSGNEPGRQGGRGGSGIVVARYQIGTITATAKATGGNVSFYNGKTIHTFVKSGTFVTTSDWNAGTNEVEYVVVAGGGGSNNEDLGGAGGAGGFIAGTTTINHPSPTAIQVGAGGNLSFSDYVHGGGGTPSYFGTPLTAYGGGGGAGKQPSATTRYSTFVADQFGAVAKVPEVVKV